MPPPVLSGALPRWRGIRRRKLNACTGLLKRSQLSGSCCGVRDLPTRLRSTSAAAIRKWLGTWTGSHTRLCKTRLLPSNVQPRAGVR
jgi:hypothetical protein